MSTRHCARALWDISVIIAIVALSPALRAQSGPFDNWLALDGTDDAAACADSIPQAPPIRRQVAAAASASRHRPAAGGRR